MLFSFNQTKTAPHRHAVVLPLALVLALLPLRDHWVALPAQVTTEQAWTASDEEMLVTLPGGRAILSPHASLSQDNGIVTMGEGSVLVRADGMLEVHAAGWRILAFDSLLHLTLRGEDLTIATLTSHVLVFRDDERIVIPAGRQWRARSSQALDAVDIVESLPLPDDFADAQVRALPSAPHPSEDAARAARGDAAAILGAVPTLSAELDPWLLLSLHPQTAGLTWTLPAPEAADIDDRLWRLRVTPQLDAGQLAYPSLVADRWYDEAISLIPTLNSPDDMVMTMAAVLEDAATAADGRGQPARALQYRRLRSRLIDHFTPIVDDDQLVQLLAAPSITIERATLEMPLETPPQVHFQEVAPVEEREPSPAMIAAVHDVLLPLGPLYTSRTKIMDVGGFARITGVAFALPAGDTFIDFTVDLDAPAIRDITRDGVTYPNAITLQQFAEWMKKE